MTTQVYEDWVPPRSLMIWGRALETIVEDRIATNMPSISPDRAFMICGWVMDAPSDVVSDWPPPPRTPGGVVVAMCFLLF
ncbi:hypothetical protein GCM10010371_58320 [Streptomyces subrutilus]|uniref:Uncharacterized protein n=1 Tax=Streptomyces subrutilus TaxID=36818 RepID=A0A918VDD1_9ACTN|nr:hypothetical protein GCM10010371_58320 [Streptomyces subrutilus]